MGTSPSEILSPAEYGDHPHAYGDKVLHLHPHSRLLGSSPRVWGQGSDLASLSTWRRIIPTRMGTRTSPCEITLRSRDHPHAYGDKVCPAVLRLHSIGSSPRVWGQGLAGEYNVCNVGIIPTRMGTRFVKTI